MIEGVRQKKGARMYQKVLRKPRKWDENSLALATKEELIADLLLRKARFGRKESFGIWKRNRRRKRELYWIETLTKELEQRSQWVIEDFL